MNVRRSVGNTRSRTVRDSERTAASARTERPLYFGGPSHELFGWYHPPGGPAPRRAGVVLCNTLGNESLRAFGTLRHLAEHLAAAGFAVLRFDFHGTGDSSGLDSDPDRVATWMGDIDLAVDELRALSGAHAVGIAGLRLGGSLALLAAARRGDVDSVLLWDPYYEGKDFVTESVRTHKMYVMLAPSTFTLKRPVEKNDGTEALGFFISNETIAALGALELRSLDRRPAKRLLIAGSAAAQARHGDTLLTHLRSLGVEAQYEAFAEKMNRNLRAVSPGDHEVIARDIATWFSANLQAANGDARPPATTRPATTTATELREEPVFFGPGGALFGILTRPDDARMSRSRPAIVVVNAGPGTRIGPHRQYVRMARLWAKLGFLVLRVDLSGSGDSLVPPGTTESDPYPPRAIADVRGAIDYLQDRFSVSRFLVAGICSGADIAFRAGVEEPRVAGALVLNPRTFALFNIPNLEEMVRVQNLAKTVSATKNWRMLFRRDMAWRDKLSRVRQVAGTAVASLKRRVRARLGKDEGAVPIVNVPADMRRMVQRGVKTLLVVGDRDVGIMHVEHHYRKEMLALERLEGFRRVNFTGVDHLFTSLYSQEVMAAAVAEHLERTYR
jgi:dienelactone hydrolase